MLKIWGRVNSHNVKKVLWLAAELGLRHERYDVGGPFGMDATYRAKNPNALIPTIEEDGLTLWESNAILRYLAARHGGERWWSTSPSTRARGDKWMDWQLTFADAQRSAFHGLVRHKPEERDQAAITRSAAEAARLMTILDAALAKTPFLSGEEMGLGDLPMGVYAHTFFTLPIERPALPHARDWYEWLTHRPGYAEHVMIPLT